MRSRLGEAASRHKGIDICDLHGQGLVMVNRHNLTQLSSIDSHRFIFEAQGPKPVNRIFWEEKPNNRLSMCQGLWGWAFLDIFWGSNAFSARHACRKKHVLGLADLVVIAPGVLFTAHFLSTASSAVSWNAWTEPPLPMVSLAGSQLKRETPVPSSSSDFELCPPGALPESCRTEVESSKAQRLEGSKAQRPMRNLGMWGAKTTTKMFRVKLDSAKWNANRMLPHPKLRPSTDRVAMNSGSGGSTRKRKCQWLCKGTVPRTLKSLCNLRLWFNQCHIV